MGVGHRNFFSKMSFRAMGGNSKKKRHFVQGPQEWRQGVGLQEKFVKWKKIIWALVQSKTLGPNPGELRLFFQIFNPFFGPLGDLCRAFPLTQPSQILAHLFFHKNQSKNQHQRIQIEKSRNKPMAIVHNYVTVYRKNLHISSINICKPVRIQSNKAYII